jgi:hypothetical protein
MKTQKNIFKFGPVSHLLLAIGFLAGCTKVDTTKSYTVSDTTQQTYIATDEVNVNNEFDNAVDDAIAALCNHETDVAGAVVDSISPNVIEIDYYGKETQLTKQRAGGDSIYLRGLLWDVPQATASITFGDDNQSIPEYEVTFLNSNSSLTFQNPLSSLRIVGNAKITNVSGILIQNLTATDSMVVQVRATIAFTWNDQSAAPQTFTWYINQIRTYTLSNGSIIATTRGDTVINGVLVSTWGTDRFSNSFYTITTQSDVQNISVANLSYNRLSGASTITGISEPIYSTYGVNNQGNIVTSGTPYGFYFHWTDNNALGSVVSPYYY